MNDRYDTFKSRLKALLFDALLFLPSLYVNNYVIKYNQDLSILVLVLWAIVYSLSFMIYRGVSHYKYGQTIGKKIFKVKVVSFPDEKNITIKHAIYREFPGALVNIFTTSLTVYMIIKTGYYLKNNTIELPYYNWIIGLISLVIISSELTVFFLSDKSRSLHDRIGETIVIKTE